MQSGIFIEKAFRSYYEENSSCVVIPSMMEKREFGFVLPRQGMFRHKRLQSREELESFLRVCAPLDAYYSCAYYDDPEADMNRKGWLGADLVFDIDADHITTPCGKIHDEWTCGSCHFTGKGLTPEECPICRGQKFDAKTWPCEECLNTAKTETIKLLDMLMLDFGFSERETHVFFSGHRGYHVHVESEIVRAFDAVARKEIVDYVYGLGLNVRFHGLNEKKTGKTRFSEIPRLGGVGWLGRVDKCMYDFILNMKQEDYREIGLRKNIIETIMRNRDAILKSWDRVGPYQVAKGVGIETWKRMAEFCAESLSAKVDTVVTTDTHRLIRMTGALHGKTGLRKIEFPISEIETFDPLRKAVAFKKGTATVFVSDAPRFRLGEETFGPFKNRKVELPTAAAVLLMCKERAEVVE